MRSWAILAWLGSEAEVLIKVLSKGSKTETAASIGIALGFLGLGLGLELGLGLGLRLSTSFHPRSLFGNGQQVLIMENKCNLAGIPIVMKLGGVRVVQPHEPHHA